MKKLFYIVVGIVFFACDDREIAYDDNFGFTAKTNPSEVTTTRIFRDEIIHFEITPNDNLINDYQYQMKYNVLLGKNGTFKNTTGQLLSTLKQDSLYPIQNNDSLLFTPLSIGEILVVVEITDNYGGNTILENSFQVSSIPFEIEIEEFEVDYVRVRVQQKPLINSVVDESLPIYDVDYFLKIEDSSEIRKLILPSGDQEIIVGDTDREISNVNDNFFQLEELSQGEHLLAISVTDEFGQTEEASLVIIKQ